MKKIIWGGSKLGNKQTIKALITRGVDDNSAEILAEENYTLKQIIRFSYNRLRNYLDEESAKRTYDTLKPFKKKPKRKKLTKFEKEQNRFSKKIRETIKNFGFKYLSTRNKHKVIGQQEGEIDAIFLYENLVLISEDTLTENVKDHLKDKHVFYEQIKSNKKQFIYWIKSEFPDTFSKFRKYQISRYRIFFLYFSKNIVELNTKDLFNYIKFIDKRKLSYFYRIARCTKYTGRNELYKFLKITLNDVGTPSSSENEKTIETAVILPEETSGFPEGIKVISFLLSAQNLMDCSFVLRRESWDLDANLYQRLLLPKKINEIREFIATDGRTFINNVIVSLPSNVTFWRKKMMIKILK